jgi:glucan biosynthesis protein C
VIQERIHYLDWLKVLIVYGIVLFHLALVFSYGTWLVSNHDKSLVLSAFAAFCFPWGIPAMFLIAGADAWFGLRSRSAVDFLRGRFMRLIVPMVPGVLILSPLQRFIVSSNPPPPIDGFFAFYVGFFRDFQFTWTLEFISRYWLHLWFLAYLFAISFACGPLLVWLRTPAGRKTTSALVKVASRRGGLFILAAPLVLTQALLRPSFPAYQDWADVATYTIAFLWGALFFSDRRFEAAVVSQIRWSLAAGMLSAPALGMALLAPRLMLELDLRIVQSILWAVFVWSLLLALLYLGIRWLNVPHRALRYAEESILPVYVIHHPVVLLVASFVVTWNLGVWPKFAISVVVVASLTLGIYEFGVRRWRLTRIFFGLSSRGPSGRDRVRPPARARSAALVSRLITPISVVSRRGLGRGRGSETVAGKGTIG